jgi:hypothetical protein
MYECTLTQISRSEHVGRAVKIANCIDDVNVLNIGHDAKYSEGLCGFPHSLQPQMFGCNNQTSASVRVHNYFTT